MCGICACLGVAAGADTVRTKVLARAKRIRHRGPDWTGVHMSGQNIIVQERLSIVDVEHGTQPLYSGDRKVVLATVGEIYNHKEMRASLKTPASFATNSDAECIIHLYKERGLNFINSLNGIFTFILIDEAKDTFAIARDHIGIVPLYYGYDDTGSLWVSSELKALHDVCVRFQEFPPGHVLHGKVGTAGTLEKWYNPIWHDEDYIPPATQPVDLKVLREALEAAVERQLMTDVPYGVLLSGGLDSSIVSAVAARCVAKRRAAAAAASAVAHADSKQSAGSTSADSGGGAGTDLSGLTGGVLHSFSVGLKGSPDLKFAAEVSKAIGTVHHEFVFTVDDGLNAVSDVIAHIETFDVTTIRASTAMYLMARKIKALGVKMVLSGEGSDEIFGGYLYFHKAPNREELHKETVRKLKALHKFDCLRANKSTMAFGLEARVPFLDKQFLDTAMTFDPTDKMCGVNGRGRIEKWVLRKAFEGYLPASVLWRQKEQFSDGVGYSWIDSLKAYAGKHVSDKQLECAKFRFPENTPLTKEAFLYRTIFESHYPSPSAAACVPGGPSVACSTPAAIAWDAAFQKNADPSGRSVAGVHSDAYGLTDEKKQTSTAPATVAAASSKASDKLVPSSGSDGIKSHTPVAKAAHLSAAVIAKSVMSGDPHADRETPSPSFVNTKHHL